MPSASFYWKQVTPLFEPGTKSLTFGQPCSCQSVSSNLNGSGFGMRRAPFLSLEEHIL